MIVLFNKDIFNNYSDKSNFTKHKYLLDIIENSKIKICISKHYIELLESYVENKLFFKSLITELNDKNRLKIVTSYNTQNEDEEFIAIANNCQLPFLIPLVYEDNNNLNSKINDLTIVNKCILKSKDWIRMELLKKGFANLSYQDFKTDSEIKSFFNEIFKVSKIIREVCIYNREQCSVLLNGIKGFNIKYYTLHDKRITPYLNTSELLKEHKNNLGGKVRFYVTTNKRILHERKVIFENLLLTVDNSFKCLSVKEPTWEISLIFDDKKANEWNLKSSNFTLLR